MNHEIIVKVNGVEHHHHILTEPWDNDNLGLAYPIPAEELPAKIAEIMAKAGVDNA